VESHRVPGQPDPAIIITTTLTDTTSIAITATTTVNGAPITITTTSIRTITRTQLSTQTSTLTTATPTTSSTSLPSHRQYPVIVELLFGVLSFYAWLQLCLSISFAILAVSIRGAYGGYRREYKNEDIRMNMVLGRTEWVTPPMRKRCNVPMPEPFPRCPVPARMKFRNIHKVDGKWVRRDPLPEVEMDNESKASESSEDETGRSTGRWSMLVVPPSDSSFTSPRTGRRRSVDIGAMRVPEGELEDTRSDSAWGSSGSGSDESSTLYYSMSTRD
jgi:hypothetical protein